MPRIVLSYRRADSSAISGRIFDRLVEHYGSAGVFMDIDEIPFGIDFRHHIAGVLTTCDAVVAVMGRAWTGSEGAPHRLDDETDPVRVEVQTALERGVPVIPVLVEGALMPDPASLPEPLRPLAYRNACEVASGRDFHAHVDRLIRSMDRMFAESGCAAGEPPRPEPRPEPAGLSSSRLFESERRGQRSIEAVAPRSASRPEVSAPVSAIRTAMLAAFLLLPHVVQFTQRTPLFVLALFVSVVGIATLLDRVDQPLGTRVLNVTLVVLATAIVQSALGVARASFLDW